MTIQTAILGSTGYTGSELIRLIDAHPYFNIAHLGAHSQAGKKLSDVLPGIGGKTSHMTLASADADIADDIQLVFTALPHAAAAKSVKKALDAGKKVVDLSADFRHKTHATYQEAYQTKHPHPELFEQAVYGLTEFSREQVKSATLVANPGCYPTSTLLPLIPLLKEGLVDTKHIIVDSKSGASGAGRSAKTNLLYCEVNEGIGAYGLPRHRHVWEMEEWAEGFSAPQNSDSPVNIRFVPHILPMTRGMLSTLHLSGKNSETWHQILSTTFADETFVNV
ncbi:MAG: N-acetyl-gamma-glutamyl-phosphate reductase, partial [Mariprofundaceae bacterium]